MISNIFVWLIALNFAIAAVVISPFSCNNQQEDSTVVAKFPGNHEFSEILETSKYCPFNDKMAGQVKNLISNAYSGDIANFKTILDFSANISNLDYKHHVFKSMMNEMVKSDHVRTKEMMMLIYHVKVTMDNIRESNELAKFDALKKELPDDMRSIIFEQKVYIRNRYYNEYVYWSKYGKVTDQIMTWRPRNLISYSDFTFQGILNRDGELRFAITIQGTNRYMDLGEFYDRDRKQVEFRSRSATHIWKLIPKGSYFAIRNAWNEAFYAPDDNHAYDKDRRYVFQWQPGQLDDYVNAQWCISPSGSC